MPLPPPCFATTDCVRQRPAQGQTPRSTPLVYQRVTSRGLSCRLAGILRLVADEEFDRGGIGQRVARDYAALEWNVESSERLEQEFRRLRRRKAAAHEKHDAHRLRVAENRRGLRAVRVPSGAAQ